MHTHTHTLQPVLVACALVERARALSSVAKRLGEGACLRVMCDLRCAAIGPRRGGRERERRRGRDRAVGRERARGKREKENERARERARERERKKEKRGNERARWRVRKSRGSYF